MTVYKGRPFDLALSLMQAAALRVEPAFKRAYRIRGARGILWGVIRSIRRGILWGVMYFAERSHFVQEGRAGIFLGKRVNDNHRSRKQRGCRYDRSARMPGEVPVFYPMRGKADRVRVVSRARGSRFAF